MGGSSKIIWDFLIESEDVIMNQCFSVLGTLHDAEDALSDIRLHLFDILSNKSDCLDEINNQTAWVKKISRNYCIDYIRKRRFVTNWDEMTPELPAGSNNPVLKLISIERAMKNLTCALNALPRTHYKALFDRSVEGKSYISIAKSQNISEVNARKRVHLARRCIRDSLSDNVITDEY